MSPNPIIIDSFLAQDVPLLQLIQSLNFSSGEKTLRKQCLTSLFHPGCYSRGPFAYSMFLPCFPHLFQFYLHARYLTKFCQTHPSYFLIIDAKFIYSALCIHLVNKTSGKIWNFSTATESSYPANPHDPVRCIFSIYISIGNFFLVNNFMKMNSYSRYTSFLFLFSLQSQITFSRLREFFFYFWFVEVFYQDCILNGVTYCSALK